MESRKGTVDGKGGCSHQEARNTMNENLEPGQLSEWVRRLRDGNETRRVHAALRLTAPGLDLTEVLGELRAGLEDEDPQVRKLVSWILGRIGKDRQAA